MLITKCSVAPSTFTENAASDNFFKGIYSVASSNIMFLSRWLCSKGRHVPAIQDASESMYVLAISRYKFIDVLTVSLRCRTAHW